MFFPQDQPEIKKEAAQKTILIYDSSSNVRKPYQIKISQKKLTLSDIKKIIPHNNLRLFNSEGVQYFQDQLTYIKNKTVLYATKGEDFDAGSCFGQYQMEGKLGEGGFGNVFLAKHKQTGEKFAIKIIKTENIGSVSDIDSIFIQAEILKSLKHENIVKVHNCLTLKNMEVAIIMQFLQGGELLNFILKQGKLDQKTARNFFKQIVRGMLYCHQNNLIHRDLKLENILLVNNEQQKIKIIDFGIAGAMSFMTWEDLDTGSLGYMAPECFVNAKNYKVDGRIDVWACGIILFGMFHGYLPFKGSNSYQTIQLIKEGKFKLNPAVQKTLSDGCLDVFRRCLDVNPKTRITMQELADHPWIAMKMFSQQKKAQKIKIQTILQQPQKKINPKAIINTKPGLKANSVPNKNRNIINKK